MFIFAAFDQRIPSRMQKRRKQNCKEDRRAQIGRSRDIRSLFSLLMLRILLGIFELFRPGPLSLVRTVCLVQG